jgi:pimeloyl-ACP methyl ester carboxylesterase
MWPEDGTLLRRRVIEMGTAIQFERELVRTPEGTRILALSSHAPGVEQRGVVVLPPGYERRIHHYAVLSDVLVRHGYRTIRFDLSNHMGLSDGETIDFTMSSVSTDLSAVIAHARSQMGDRSQVGDERLYVVAPSLAARAAFRSLSSDCTVDGLVALLPVVDVRYTITQAAGSDVIGRWQAGEFVGKTQIRISKSDIGRRFPEDALGEDWGGLDQGKRELAAVACPVVAIAAEHDDWVRTDDVQVALEAEARGSRRYVVMEASSHDLASNLPVLRLMLELTVSSLDSLHGASREVRVPEFSEFVELVTRERRWAHGNYEELVEDRLIDSDSSEVSTVG